MGWRRNEQGKEDGGEEDGCSRYVSHGTWGMFRKGLVGSTGVLEGEMQGTMMGEDEGRGGGGGMGGRGRGRCTAPQRRHACELRATLLRKRRIARSFVLDLQSQPDEKRAAHLRGRGPNHASMHPWQRKFLCVQSG